MARWIGLFAIVISISLLGAAEGQEPKKIDIDAIFKKLDSNSDNKLSKDEFLKLADSFKDKDKARAKLTRTFDEIDPKNVGLTKDHFRKYLESVNAKRKEKTR